MTTEIAVLILYAVLIGGMIVGAVVAKAETG